MEEQGEGWELSSLADRKQPLPPTLASNHPARPKVAEDEDGRATSLCQQQWGPWWMLSHQGMRGGKAGAGERGTGLRGT